MGETVEIDFSSMMKAVGGLQRQLSDAHRTLPIIAEALVSSVQDVFEHEGAVGGKPRWEGLKKSTLRKRRKSSNPKILQDTGILAASIAPASSDRWVAAYTGVRYAKYHISDLPRRVIPLRDFFDVDLGEFYAEAADVILSKFR